MPIKTKAETDAVTEDVEAPQAPQEPVQPVRQKQVSVDHNEMIPVRNVTSGSLTYISRKSGLEVRWMNPQDVEYIPYGELLAMKAGQPTFLTRPFCMVDDEQIVDTMGLRNLYNTFIAVEDIDGFFRLPLDQMEEKLKIAPKGIKETIAQNARTLVEMGQLDSMRVIKMLERELTIDLLMVQKDE